MKLVAVLVALVTLASGGFQTLPPIRAASSPAACRRRSPSSLIPTILDFLCRRAGRPHPRRPQSRRLPRISSICAPRTLGGGERGLLGMALAPDFPASGRFYVNFTNTNGDTVVARFNRSNGGTVDPASRFDLRWGPERSPVILQPFVEPQRRPSRFRPRWLSLHRAGRRRQRRRSAEQRADSVNAARQDAADRVVSVADNHPNGYVVPADNPFVSSSLPGVRPEIWSFGLRNPWRYSFDPVSLGGSGALLMGDVGKDAGRDRLRAAGTGGRTMDGALRKARSRIPIRRRTPRRRRFSH